MGGLYHLVIENEYITRSLYDKYRVSKALLYRYVNNCKHLLNHKLFKRMKAGFEINQQKTNKLFHKFNLISFT